MSPSGSCSADSITGPLFQGRAIQSLQHLMSTRYLKKAHRMSVFWINGGYAVLVQDESHVQLKIVPKRTWNRQKNTSISTKVMWGNKSHHNGRHWQRRDALFWLYNSGNWKNTKDFLLKVYEQFGPVLIFMNNYYYHKKREIKALTRKLKGNIQIRCLPTERQNSAPLNRSG